MRIAMALMVAAALCLGAAFASWSPAPGHEQLRWAPVSIGVPFLVLWAVAEGLRRLFRSRTAKALATLAISAAAVLVLLRLRIAFFTPTAGRDADTWHLWTMFTAVNMAVIALPLLGLAALMEGVTRLSGRGHTLPPKG